jgi:hypothetical protein
MTNTQTELERLREEVTQLRKALAERSTPPVPGFITDDTPNLPTNDTASLIQNFELITDLTRFAEGLLEERHVRKKYCFTEDTWTALGSDEKFIEAVELERIRRVRDGSYKRERSQQLVTKAPDVLSGLLLNEKNSPKHRIDAVKVLDDLAEGGPRAAHDEGDRVIVTIKIGDDAGDILRFDKSVKPIPSDDTIIDAAPVQQELPPPRRGPGRPPGSKNKPKQPELDATLPLPGFAV